MRKSFSFFYLFGVCVVVSIVSTLLCFSTPAFSAASWSTTPEILGTSNYETAERISPNVAVNIEGHAFVVWHHKDSTGNYWIFEKSYDADTSTSSSTVTLATNESADGFISAPEIVANNNSHAFVIWQEFDGTHYSIKTTYYNGASWEDENEVVQSTVEYSRSQIDINDSEYALAVSKSGDRNIVGISFDPTLDGDSSTHDGAWEEVTTVDDLMLTTAAPQVAMDSNGNAVVVWHQGDSDKTHIYANTCNELISTWEGPQRLDPGNTNAALSPKIAMVSSSNVIVVWYQSDGSYDRIYATRYDGTSWSTPEILDAGAEGATNPRIAMDAVGNAIAVWEQSSGGINDVYASAYDVATGTWTRNAEPLDTSTGDASLMPVVMNGNGEAVTVWFQSDGSTDDATTDIYASHYSNGVWSTKLVHDGDYDSLRPFVAIDDSGNAFAAWVQENATGTSDVYAKIFSDLCGNKVIDSGEDCDDGNTTSGDGCSSACTNEPVEDCTNSIDDDNDGLVDCDDTDCSGLTVCTAVENQNEAEQSSGGCSLNPR